MLAEKPDLYRGILAITFTNKAAEEMKTRVVNVLSKLASGSKEEDAMASLLMSELNVSESVLQTRAQQTLGHMLHHYSDISISTIDHFTHKVIRTFAQDLGLSINFEVELDTDRIKHEVVKQLLQMVGEDRVLTAALIDVVQSRIDEEGNWSIDALLEQFASTLFSEESRFHLERLRTIGLQEFNELRSELRSKLSASATRMVALGQSSLGEIQANGLSADKFFQGAKGIYGFLSNASKGSVKDPNSYVIKTLEEDKWMSGKATSADEMALDAIKMQLEENTRQIIQINAENGFLQLVFDHIYSIALLDEMQRIQQLLQTEEELLHIGEFNHIVSKVVMTETAPFIYERIGHKYKHFLVDEFQDTSVLQWFNLLPLIDESLAHDNLCLVVGDAKQSIYRWRGGDVQQFVQLPDIHRTDYLKEQLADQPQMSLVINQREQVLKANAEVENLAFNYRSSETVVNFNNALFSSLKTYMPESLQKMYEGNEQTPYSKRQGLVSLRFFPGESNREEYDAMVQDCILEWVRDCIADGFAAGDIAIICRTNKEAVKLAQYLISNELQVVSNESLLINSSPSVRLLVNLATFAHVPENRVNIAELIQNLGLVRTDTEMTSERLMFVNQRKDPTLVIQLLAELFPTLSWAALKQESLFGIFEHLKHAVFNNAKDAYITYFMDEVLGFGKTTGNDMSGFLEFWSEKRAKRSIALSENSDSIRLLTIHKSKGLEFPIVMHPYADYPDPRKKNSIWVYMDDERTKPLDRLRVKASDSLSATPFAEDLNREVAVQQMDMLNEMYVALTRAKERLYVSGKLKNANAKDSSPSTAIQYIFEHVSVLDSKVREQFSFQVGDRVKTEKKEGKKNDYAIASTGDPFWKQRISISRPSKERWKTADPNDARNLGILIHEAMATIETEKDIDAALALLVEDGRIGKAETESLKTKIQHLMSKDELVALYSDGKQIRNEADIQLANGKWVRPDRVVSADDHAWVLDYKTGGELKKHHQQMAVYKEAMHELGFEQVEGLLVYLDEERIVKV